MPFRTNLKPLELFEGRSPQQANEDDQTTREPKAPTCPNCKTQMSWYNSRLQRQNGSQKIVHSFVCPNCATVVETDEPKKLALRVV